MKKIMFFLLLSIFSKAQDYEVFNNFYDNTGLSNYQIKVLDSYKDKKFINEDVFLTDLNKLITNNIYKPSDFQAECLGYFMGKELASGDIKSLKKFNYYEIYAAAEGQCYIRDMAAKEEIIIQEKKPVFKVSHIEANQYIQIQFEKTKKGYTFYETKIIEGDKVNKNSNIELQERIKQDFSDEKNGNYTAFYDISFLNDKIKEITLKTRLSR